MCQKWFVKFHAGDFSLDNAPCSSTTVEVVSDQTETLTENSLCYTMQEIAGILKISKPIVIGRNEKCVFYFTEQTKRTYWPTHISSICNFHL